MKVMQYIEEIIVVIALAAMTLVSFANIIMRNFANISLSFTEEITINLFVLLTFVGTAIGVRRYAHLGFTLIFDRVNAGLKKGIIIFSLLMSLLLFGVLFWYGIQMSMFQLQLGQRTPALSMPQWILSLSMPIGALLCIIRTVQVTIEELREVNTANLKGDNA